MRLFCEHCAKEVDTVISHELDARICAFCGSVVKPLRLRRGTMISGFRIEDEIGRGGMGIVYRANQINLERFVALKILTDEAAQDTDFVHRFFKEARAAGGLSHPNIVQAYDAGATPEGVYYFAMELVEGETLDTRIQRDGMLPEKTALDIAVQIAEALEYAWDKQKLSHGDIKPDNIILNSSGDAKLADLGLAKTKHDNEIGGEIMATPLYAAPEVIKGDGNAGDKSDMYSFGATMYHMLSGAPPFPGDDPETVLRRHLDEQHKTLRSVNKELRRSVSEFVDGLLSKNPDDRPESWRKISSELKELAAKEAKVFHRHATATQDSSHMDINPAEIAETTPSHPIRRLAVMVIILLLAAAAGITMLRKSRNTAVRHGGSVMDKFTRLERRIKSMEQAQAIESLDSFIAEHGAATPEAARDLLRQHRGELAENEKNKIRRQRDRDAYQNEVETLKSIAAGIKKPEMMKSSELFDISKRITSALEQGTEFGLSKNDRKELNNHFLVIRSAASKRQRQETEAKRLENIQRQKAEAKKLADKRLAADAELDKAIDKLTARCAYQALLTEATEKNSEKNARETLENGLKRWSDDYGGKFPELKSRAEFLLEQVRTLPTIIPALASKPILLVDKPLPVSRVPANYRISKISDKTIRLMTVGNVKIGKKLAWSSLSNQELTAIAEKFILPARGKLRPQESTMAAIGLFMMINHDHNAEKAFSGLANAKQWLEIIHDFKTAETDSAANSEWLAAAEALAAGRYGPAAQSIATLMAMKNKAAWMDDNACATIIKTAGRYRLASPAMAAILSTVEINGEIKNTALQNTPRRRNRLLTKAVTAFDRFGNNPQVAEATRKNIAFNKAKMLASADSESPVKNLDDNKIPFYRWEDDLPEEAWVFERRVRDNRLFRGENQQAIIPIQLAAAVSMGDWTSVRKLYYDQCHQRIEWLSRHDNKLINWAPGLLFAYGVAANRFNDGNAKNRVLESLVSHAAAIPAKDPRKPSFTTLAMEYAAIIRRWEVIREMSEKIPFDQIENPAMHSRAAMMTMLAGLMMIHTDANAANQAINHVRAIFGDTPESRLQLECCELAAALVGDASTENNDNDARLAKFTETNFPNRELGVRIIIEAAAAAECNGEHAAIGWNKLSKLAQASVTDNFAGSTLWRTAAVYRLAHSAYNQEKFMLEIERIFDDYRLPPGESYPGIIMLAQAGRAVWRGDGGGAARKTFEAFSDNCPVFSEQDKNSANLLIGKINTGFIDRAFNAGQPETAFWSAAMLSILADKKTEFKKDILENIDGHGAALSWPEKLLIRRLTYR